MKFLCDSCKAKYQIADEKVAGRTVRMKCRRCGYLIEIHANVTQSSVAQPLPTAPPGQAGIPAAAPSADPIPLVARTPPPRPPVHDDDDERTVIMQSPPAARSPARDDAPASSRRPSAIGALATRASEAPPRPGGPPRPGIGTPPPAGRPLPAPRPGAAPTPAPRAVAAATPAPAAFAPQSAALSGSASGPSTATPSPAREVAAASSGIAGAFARAVTAPAPAPPPAPPSRAPSEDWYVGIGGVPIGPIRLAVIREKAAQGSVDGDSLVWREGFDEWQPLKNFPELFEIVLEAQSARNSFPGRRSGGMAASPAPIAARSTTPASTSASVASLSALAGASAPAGPTAGTSPARAAAEATGTAPEPKPTPAVDMLADPFSAPRAAPAAAAANGAPAAAAVVEAPRASSLDLAPLSTAPDSLVAAPRQRRGGMHPMAYAFIAMAASFGGVFAWFLLTRSPPPAPQIVVVQGPTPAGNAPPPPPSGEAAAPAADNTVTLDPIDPQAVRPGVGGPRPPGAPTGGSPSDPSPIDTRGFGGTVPGPATAAPGETTGGSAGTQLSAGEIQGVVSQNQPLVKRKCWQPALDAKSKDAPTTARVNAKVTIGPSGNVESVNAGGADKDYPGLAGCVASRIKGWKFPPSGGSTSVNIPFVFAGQ